MTDLQATLDAIDAATGCQQCGGPLGDSPSGDFCSEDHQQAWHASQVGAEGRCLSCGGPLEAEPIDITCWGDPGPRTIPGPARCVNDSCEAP